MSPQSETATSRLVQVAREWQKSLGVTDTAFARLLGRHKSTWSLLQSGAHRPSPKTVRTLLAQAPEPWKSALEKAYLADRNAEVAA